MRPNWKSHFEKLAAEDGPWVLICNYGRGIQTCWPSGEKPGLYDKKEATKLLKKLEADAEKSNKGPHSGSPYSQKSWHMKLLSEALKYVSGGNSCYSALRRLQEKEEFSEDEDY